MLKSRMLHLTLSIVLGAGVFTASAQQSLSIWMTGSDSEATALENAAQVFTAETGIAVTVTAVAWGSAYASYQDAIKSGSGADMFTGGMSWGISLGGIGGLVDLGERFPDEIDDVLAGNNPEFVNATIGVDGGIYGVPFNQNVFLMYYLPENLARVGFNAPPATWDELTAALEALKVAGLGGGAINWGNAQWISFQPFLAQAGGSWYTEDCSAAAINSGEAVVALEYYASLYRDYDFPQGVMDFSGFAARAISILFDHQGIAPSIDLVYPDLAGRWAVAPLPVGPAGNSATFIGGKMMGIFSYSPNADAAWQFIKWLQTAEAGQAIVSESSRFHTMFVPPQHANTQYIVGSESLNRNVNLQLQQTTPPPHCSGWEENSAAVDEIIREVLFENGEFEDALSAMEATLNANLVAYGG